MRKWTLYLANGFLKILSSAFLFLPQRWREGLGKSLGRLFFLLRFRRKVAVSNLKIAFPELQESEHLKLALKNYQHLGQSLTEYLYLPKLTDIGIEKQFQVTGEEHLRKVLDEGRGAFLLTLHLGNGDLALASLAKRGYPITIVSREAKVLWVNDIWFYTRRQVGIDLVSVNRVSFSILKALKANRLVVFVLDQFMGPPHGLKTRFFAKETGTAMGLAVLALRSQVPIIPCYTFRKGEGVHHLTFEEPWTLKSVTKKKINTQQLNAEVAQLTQRFTDWTESIVRLYPEQWMWVHRRWKPFPQDKIEKKSSESVL